MKPKTRIILFSSIAGALALGIGGFFLWKRSKGKKLEEYDTPVKRESGNGGASASNVLSEHTVGYVAERAGDEYDLVPHLGYPRPAAGTINKGDVVQLIGMGPYSGYIYDVAETWIDKNGKLGALYLYDGEVSATNPTNRNWEGKGKIQVIKE